MYKYIKYTALLAILALAILFSCQKNEGVEIDEPQAFEMTESAQIAYNKLVAFKNAIENPQKSTVAIDIDSAGWYVEAYYNVKRGLPEQQFSSFKVDTMYYMLPLNENMMVSISELAILLNDIEEHLDYLLDQSSTDGAHMVVGDVVIDLTGRSSEAEVTVYTGMGLGQGRLYVPFEDEYWYWGYTLGRCDPVNPPPPPPYHDAGDELEWRFNNPNPWHVPLPTCQNGKLKIIGASHVWRTGLTENRIYYELNVGPYDPPCLDPETLNTLLSYGAGLFYQKESNNGLIPDGNHYFTSVDISTFADSIAGYGWRYYHGYAVYYAIYECLPGGIFD